MVIVVVHQAELLVTVIVEGNRVEAEMAEASRVEVGVAEVVADEVGVVIKLVLFVFIHSMFVALEVKARYGRFIGTVEGLFVTKEKSVYEYDFSFAYFV